MARSYASRDAVDKDKADSRVELLSRTPQPQKDQTGTCLTPSRPKYLYKLAGPMPQSTAGIVSALLSGPRLAVQRTTCKLPQFTRQHAPYRIQSRCTEYRAHVPQPLLRISEERVTGSGSARPGTCSPGAVTVLHIPFTPAEAQGMQLLYYAGSDIRSKNTDRGYGLLSP